MTDDSRTLLELVHQPPMQHNDFLAQWAHDSARRFVETDPEGYAAWASLPDISDAPQRPLTRWERFKHWRRH